MGKKLKFFILLIFATVALVGCTVETDSQAVENQTNISCPNIDVQYFDLDAPNVDLSLPRQISGISNIHRVPNVVKRTTSWHRNNFEFVKSGKVVNVCICDFIQKESLSYHHRFVKSTSWLISLGKLII